MSIETEPAGSTPSERVDELADALGGAITDLQVYDRYEEAKAAVEANEDAQERIREFEQLRQEFAMARQTGKATQEDLAELQAAQERLHEIQVMEEYLAVQSELELRLQELNERISEHLLVDFGEKAGGCCADE